MNSKHRAAATAAACALCVIFSTLAHADEQAASDSFYTYSDVKGLADMPLGKALKTRDIQYKMPGIRAPLAATQILYRTTDALGRPIANVTTFVKTPAKDKDKNRVISYQSAYDSLNPADSPSRIIASSGDILKASNFGANTGIKIYDAEQLFLTGMLQEGYSLIIPDTEGPNADFMAGPEYGKTTLDSIRAVINTSSTGVTTKSPIALIGYSGGAIATNWAAQLAPSYAPQVNAQLVGAAEGGVLVDPVHNLSYVNGSLVWGGVAAAAFAGMSRAFNYDLKPYLSDDGVKVMDDIKDKSLIYILPKYAGTRWASWFKPEYANNLNSIPKFVDIANQLNAGLAASPTIPMYITQGLGAILNGTLSLQPGDGVMLAMDVRALAKKFCDDRVPVIYDEQLFDHGFTAVMWLANIRDWLSRRFEGESAPDNCSSPLLWFRNSLDAEKAQ